MIVRGESRDLAESKAQPELRETKAAPGALVASIAGPRAYQKAAANQSHFAEHARSLY
jgi:hypothetical protein